MLDIDPQFGVVGMALAVLLAAYAIVGEPILGRRWYERLERERDLDPHALLRVYRLTFAIQWACVALVGAILLIAPRLDPASVGLALPGGDHLLEAVGFTAYVVAIVVVTGLILRRRAAAGKAVPGQSALSALLPRTSPERRLAVGVAFTAGICEEIVYRGFLIAFAVAVLGLSVVPAAIVAVAVFTLAHLYQGAAGMVGVGVLGAVFAALYVSTGSLLLPIVVHVVVDLRGLVMVPIQAGHERDGMGQGGLEPPSNRL